MSIRGPNVRACITLRADTNLSLKNSPQKILSDRTQHGARYPGGIYGNHIPCDIGGIPALYRGIYPHTPHLTDEPSALSGYRRDRCELARLEVVLALVEAIPILDLPVVR